MALVQEVSGALTVNGAATNIALTAGQNGRLSFTGTAGQNLGLGISALDLTPDTVSYASVTVYKPDANSLTSSTCYVSNGGCDLDLLNLPLTGTYSVLVEPYQDATASFTATLSADITANLVVNGSAYDLNIARPGQDARLNFSGSSGQQITLRILASTMGNMRLSLFKPDGSPISVTTSNGDPFNLPSQTLQANGNHTFTVDPTGVNLGTLSISVTSP